MDKHTARLRKYASLDFIKGAHVRSAEIAEAAEALDRLTLRWTTEAPTEVGRYWLRDIDGDVDVVRIWRDPEQGGSLWVGGMQVAYFPQGCQWSDKPIALPVEA